MRAEVGDLTARSLDLYVSRTLQALAVPKLKRNRGTQTLRPPPVRKAVSSRQVRESALRHRVFAGHLQTLTVIPWNKAAKVTARDYEPQEVRSLRKS